VRNRIFAGALIFLIFLLSFGVFENSEKEKLLIPNTSISTLKTDSEEHLPIQEKKEEAIPVKEETVISKTEETEEIEIEEETPASPVCTLIVRCDDILKNPEKLKEEKRALVPADGIIYINENAEFAAGETVFDVLHRCLRENKIHFEFVNTPMYNSVYIEGIGNIYEFDCGSLSGWMYRVNGIKPTYGCSQYSIKDGDKIEFYHSCNLLGDNTKNS